MLQQGKRMCGDSEEEERLLYKDWKECEGFIKKKPHSRQACQSNVQSFYNDGDDEDNEHPS